MRTRSLGFRIAQYLLAGFVLQTIVTFSLAVPHGERSRVTTNVHNPRIGDEPIAIVIDERFGATYAYGMGRPGTLIDRYPEQVHEFQGGVWWPRKAITFLNGDDNFAVAVGWPLRSFTGWCDTVCIDIPPDGFEMQWRAKNAVLLSSQNTRDKFMDSERPFVVPVRLLWVGTLFNTIVYSVSLALFIGVTHRLMEKRRRARGLCARCAYPIGASPICPECGYSTKSAPV